MNNTFVNAVINQEERTENGMKAYKDTMNANVTLFFKIGASRGQNIIPGFTAAFVENPDIATRIVAWSRDIRGGAGERQLFRDILKHLANTDIEACKALIKKAPELGRWDDILVFDKNSEAEIFAFDLIEKALNDNNGLCAKWMPRKGEIAVRLREYFGWSPKFYRKTLVNLTNVVETKMCAKEWDDINFSHVPSVASARYKTAFNRNTVKYGEYVASLVKGDDPTVKVNASAIFPYDVLKGRIFCGFCEKIKWTKVELDLVQKQWESLPNYVGDANILPLIDVSGSMICPVGKNLNLTALEVAVSLGLYLADKNVGKFKDTFLTFSSKPELLHLKGNINQKIDQIISSKWAMSTNLHAAFDQILKVAKLGNVPAEEMPKMLLILSDMQFNGCVQYDDSAIEMIRRKYTEAGYEVPNVVFWNIAARDNVPVKFNEMGVALVSGFSPAIVKPLLAGDKESFTPLAVMMKTIMQDRYAVL